MPLFWDKASDSGRVLRTQVPGCERLNRAGAERADGFRRMIRV
jgi:hypothetical protein